MFYYDLSKDAGVDHPEGITLDYFIEQERQILIANGVSPDYSESMSRVKWVPPPMNEPSALFICNGSGRIQARFSV